MYHLHDFLYCLTLFSPKKALKDTACLLVADAGSFLWTAACLYLLTPTRPVLVANMLSLTFSSTSPWHLTGTYCLSFQRGKMQALGLGVEVKIEKSSLSIYFGSNPSGWWYSGKEYFTKSCPVYSENLGSRSYLLPLSACAFLRDWRWGAGLDNGQIVFKSW